MEQDVIQWSDFAKIDLRIGTIISAENFREARMPAYKVNIDLGELGIRKSSAQITDLYSVNSLIGKQVIVVVNFSPKQIANYMSECLILGAYNEDKSVTLLRPERKVSNGMKVG